MKFIKKRFLGILIIVLLLVALSFPLIFTVYERYKPYYSNKDFNIADIKSEVDANNNGIDDYTDILLGARIDAKNHPKYDSRYWDNGYPPDNIGVCTDVIWRAFKNAGYNLREMLDNDIEKYNKEYYHLKHPDSNIDFRRVSNLYKFFNKYAESLTNDIKKIEEWQPGDIVVFGEKTVHIGIISDRRNRKGEPYVIHNSGQLNREEDILAIRNKKDPISGHFRFNAKELEDIVVYWK